MGSDPSEINGGGFNHRKLVKPKTCQQRARNFDDLPPSRQNRVVGGKVMGKGRTAAKTNACGKMQNDMDVQIHRLQIAAYSSVLRAFRAECDLVTWEQESLMTELRRELNVSSEEHSKLLVKVNEDGIIQKFRKMRQAGTPISKKRKRVSPPASSLSVYPPSPDFHSQPIATPTQPSAVAARLEELQSDQMLPSVLSPKWIKCRPPGSSGGGQVANKKPKCSTQYHPAGSNGKEQTANKNSYGTPTEKAPPHHDSLIGRKIQIRWPEDNTFYKAVITNYSSLKDQHLLAYGTDTGDQSWEWVNLKEIYPEDIIWEAKDPGINHQPDQDAPAQRVTESTHETGTRIIKHPPSQTRICKKSAVTIKILQTHALLKEVEKILGAENPDPRQIEKADQIIKEHKQSLIDAIKMLTNPSNGEGGKDM